MEHRAMFTDWCCTIRFPDGEMEHHYCDTYDRAADIQASAEAADLDAVIVHVVDIDVNALPTIADEALAEATSDIPF